MSREILLPNSVNLLSGIGIIRGEDELVVTRLLDDDGDVDDPGHGHSSGADESGHLDPTQVGGDGGRSSVFTDYRRPESWSADDLQALVKLFPLEFKDFCRRTSPITNKYYII